MSTLLPAIRELYSRHPEYFHHEPWELPHVLFSLCYVEDLAGEKRERRSDELREAWRRHHPSEEEEGKGRPA